MAYATIDTYYALIRRRILPISLADAIIQLGLLCCMEEPRKPADDARAR